MLRAQEMTAISDQMSGVNNPITLVIDRCLMGVKSPTLDQSERLDRLTGLQVQQQRSTMVHHWETLGRKHMA